MGAAAVQRHRQMQGVTRPETHGRILEQLGRLAKPFAIEGAKFHSALQQALELLPSGLACFRTETVMALLIRGSRDSANQSSACALRSSGVSRATTTLVSR
jgi:hypothetical protein